MLQYLPKPDFWWHLKHSGVRVLSDCYLCMARVESRPMSLACQKFRGGYIVVSLVFMWWFWRWIQMYSTVKSAVPPDHRLSTSPPTRNSFWTQYMLLLSQYMLLLSFLDGYFSSFKNFFRQREICKKSWEITGPSFFKKTERSCHKHQSDLQDLKITI